MKEAITDYHHIIAEIEDYAFLLLDKNGTIIDWNKGAEKLKGYTAVEIIGQNFRVFYTKEDRKNNLPEKLIAKATSVGKAMNEGWRVRKDGSRFWGNILITALHDREGRVKGFQKITRDLSEAKKLEEYLRHTNDDLEIRVQDRTKKLEKASRLYAFISAVNQSIVQISDEQALLDNVCKIALGIGEFKMAWIAMLDRDRMLHMASVHGDTMGVKRIMKHSGIHADDPIMRDIPTGKVIRTGKYEYCNDMQHEPAYERWREEFISQGIHASIALPIMRGGLVAGVFSLQAGSKDFFDESEITLLKEAAGDISFALDNFDKEKKRIEAEEKIRHNEERLRQAQILAHIGSWEVNIAEGVSVWSDENCRIFGLAVEDNRQSTEAFLAFVHPDDLAYVTDIIQSAKVSLQGSSFYTRIIRKDGSIRHVNVERRYELDTYGRPKRIYGICHDITDKTLADEQREFDRNNLNALINNTSDYMWSVDTGYRLITYNQPLSEIIKKATGRELVSGRDMLSYSLSQEQADYYQGFYERAFAGERFTETEYMQNPRESWSEISFYPIREGDKIIGAACHSRDITERKRAELQITESEKKFRNLFYDNPMPLWIMDPVSFKFLDVNKAALDQYGYSREEFLSMHALDLRPADDHERFRELSRTFKEGMSYVGVWTHLKKDGRQIEVEVSSAGINYEGTPARLILVNDVTERNKATAQLEAKQAEMETLLNNTEESFILLDTDLNMVSYNKLANDKAISLIHAPLYKGMPIFQLADPRNIPNLKEIYKKVLKGESAETEVRSKLGGTEELVFKNSIKPVFDDAGAVIGVFISASDVTEKRKAEIKIRELNEHLEERVQERTAELSEANKALEAFSYSVSHDLMAPVRSMIGFAKIIRQDHAAHMDPGANELLGYIEDSGKRMNEIISDLLKLARYGKDEIKLETVDMDWLISGVWLNIGRTNPNHAILEMAALPMVEVDMGMMQQVVVNLLTNAIKYSSKIVKPVVRIWCESDEKTHTFFFKDNGAGFDMKHYDRLFGAFQRLHTIHEYEGTGVGLTLVKRIIEKHGGTIAAEAEVGKGATFYFTLPVSSIVPSH